MGKINTSKLNENIKLLKEKSLLEEQSCKIIEELLRNGNNTTFANLQNAQQEIKKIEYEYINDSNVSLNDYSLISGFYDKIYYDFPRFATIDGIYDLEKNSLKYFREIDMGSYNGKGKMSLSVEVKKDTEDKETDEDQKVIEVKKDLTYTIYEKKLLTIIEHYFIKLCNQKNNYDFNSFYIPLVSLKYMFPNGESYDRNAIHEKIRETCERLNEKQIYWNFSEVNSVKSKCPSFSRTIDSINYIDIRLLYNVRKVTNKGNVSLIQTLKGIYCTINDFWKLRFCLGQISNEVPIQMLSLKPLQFEIIKNLIYRINLASYNDSKPPKKKNEGKRKVNKKRVIKPTLNISFSSLLVNSFDYNKGLCQKKKTYYNECIEIANKTDKIKSYFEETIKVLEILVNNKIISNAKLKLSNNKSIEIFYKNSNDIVKALDIDDIIKNYLIVLKTDVSITDIDELYNIIRKIRSTNQYIKDGEIPKIVNKYKKIGLDNKILDGLLLMANEDFDSIGYRRLRNNLMSALKIKINGLRDIYRNIINDLIELEIFKNV